MNLSHIVREIGKVRLALPIFWVVERAEKENAWKATL